MTYNVHAHQYLQTHMPAQNTFMYYNVDSKYAFIIDDRYSEWICVSDSVEYIYQTTDLCS